MKSLIDNNIKLENEFMKSLIDKNIKLENDLITLSETYEKVVKDCEKAHEINKSLKKNCAGI